jgi:hypothetical protein
VTIHVQCPGTSRVSGDVPTVVANHPEGVRLDAAPILSGKGKTEVIDLLVNGGFVILGAIIAAVAGYLGALQAAKAQVKAVDDQREEERRRFQQTRHQKKYEIAWVLRQEVKRLGVAAEKRIPLAQVSRSGTSRHPLREEMTISAFPLMRGEREDIGLLSDELQDKALDLVSEVDDYNSHIETLPRTAADPISVDQAAEQKLILLRDKARLMIEGLSIFITRVRDWRCKRCEAFIDEILDVSEDGQRKRCPICNNTTRIAQVRVTDGAQSTVTAAANVVRNSSTSD